MVNRLERAIAALCVVLVLLVLGSVGFALLFLPSGLHSGVPEVAARSELSLGVWLDTQRLPVQGAAPPPCPAPLRGSPSAKSEPTPASRTRPDLTKPSLATEETVPPAERAFPDVPWLRRRPGVRYVRPRRIPHWLKRKHESLEDARRVAQGGGGRFVEGPGGQTRYELTWLDPESQLGLLGLRPRDRIAAVNGLPLGRTVASGHELYQRLKGAERFTILIEREGQHVLLSYEVR